MLDTEFKNFAHLLAPGDSIHTNGNILQGSYRPDISIKNKNKKVYLILESERKSERKAFIGAMVHASKFAYETKQIITLVFVMKETGNQTTVAQVSRNIRPYFEWLCSLGSTYLNRVLMISDIEYENSARAGETLLSDIFLQRCTQL